MDFRLKVFYTVASRLSFTKAAAELFITQPAVSKHIQDQLEYNKVNPDNIKRFADYKDKVTELKNLVELLEKYGSKHEIVLQKIVELKSKPHIYSDIN